MSLAYSPRLWFCARYECTHTDKLSSLVQQEPPLISETMVLHDGFPLFVDGRNRMETYRRVAERQKESHEEDAGQRTTNDAPHCMSCLHQLVREVGGRRWQRNGQTTKEDDLIQIQGNSMNKDKGLTRTQVYVGLWLIDKAIAILKQRCYGLVLQYINGYKSLMAQSFC